MKFTIGQGMNRDPEHRGPKGVSALGLSTDIINWPQTIAQWWGTAFLLAFFALPWGIWGALFDETRLGGVVMVAVYFSVSVLFGVAGLALRHARGEDYLQLTSSMALGALGLAGTIWLGIYRTFSDGQWFAGIVVVAISLILINQVFRSWQTMLVLGLFTEQKRLLTPPPEFAEQVSKYRRKRTS
jgi:hypothetical protein